MVRRRLGVWLSLAVLVAVVAHGLRFGAEHLPAGAHAASLLGMLGAGLVLAALAALYAAALRRRAPAASPRWQCAFPAVLALGGLGAYNLIELSEGHAPFAGGPRVLLAVGLAAVLVFGLSRLTSKLLAASGEALAAFAAVAQCAGVPSAVTLRDGPVLPPHRLARREARGRAPPLRPLTLSR